MELVSTRFGSITIDENEFIEFPEGLIGFPVDKKFVLLRQRENSPVAWLHSVTNGALAFPVISLDALTVTFAECDIAAAAEAAGLNATLENLSVMLVFAAPGKNVAPTVNLVAPIIVDAVTRTGAQVIIDGTGLTASEPLAMWVAPPPAPNTEENTPVTSSEIRPKKGAPGAAPLAADDAA
jgi:flagellar assembly factor FliW